MFDLATELKVSTIATPTLATGYGRMTVEQFGAAYASLIDESHYDFGAITIVVRHSEAARVLQAIFATTGQ